MCLDRGHKPSVEEFKDRAHHRNLDNLEIWHNVGRDVENGIWAMAGARQGTAMTMLSDWDHTEVQWFDNLEKLWNECESDDAEQIARDNGKELARLDLDVAELDEEQSKFFKKHYRSNWQNQGPMVREIDVLTK